MVIPPQDTLFFDEVKVEQNSPITNQEWSKQQNQDKTIAEIKDILESKKHSQ